MRIIGRKKEIEILDLLTKTNKPEFLVVYGRRRVGKTYLVKEYFNNQFAFYATGLLNGNMKSELKAFNDSLRSYGLLEKKIPTDWYEAFSRLRQLIESETVKKDSLTGKVVVFLDEVPWMDTARSDFKSALDYFWNTYGSTNPNLLLILCGSATSWIVNNILSDRGGFYNRITRRIHLMPFTIKECAEFYEFNNIPFSKRQIFESYMIFGGIPYYLNLLNSRLSLAQNVDELIFSLTGELHFEYNHLFKSLFKNYSKHEKIIEELAKVKNGLTRLDLSKKKEIGDGRPLTVALEELEESGFIRKYNNISKDKSGYFYQLVDSFTLFYNKVINEDKTSSWINYIGTPSYYAWCGNAFEILCLNHIEEIKRLLGISGVNSSIYAWRSKTSSPNVQIDLIIDRKDDVINICEMKYSDNEFVINGSLEKEFLNKKETFREETKTKKACLLTLVTINGISHNDYYGVIQNEVNIGDLL